MTSTIPVEVDRPVDGGAELATWLQRFALGVHRGVASASAAESLFVEAGWWRDLLTLCWDLRTFAGRDAVATALDSFDTSGWTAFAVDTGSDVTVAEEGGTTVVSGFFTFGTSEIDGRGFVRLLDDGSGTWKAWTLLTQVDGLRGVDEPVGARRPLGLEPVAVDGRERWWDAHRHAEIEFADSDPEVVVVGAGQAGLAVAAQLTVLGVPTLVLESHDRIGDGWRRRYPSLTLHDPIWANRLPFLDYPQTWPVFMPRSKFAAWLEAYAESLDLNVWTGCADTEISRSGAGEWTVRTTRDGLERVLRPRDVVVATGLNGTPTIPEIDGMAGFGGSVTHSSTFAGGQEWKGRRAVVVGAGTSAHDIAQDLCEQGAEVTLVQRSGTLPVSRDFAAMAYVGKFDEAGPPLADADMAWNSMPWNLLIQLTSDQTVWREAHAELLDALARTDYEVEYGGGIMARYLTGVNGYYLDVGALGLIADGRIRVKQGVPIESAGADSLTFADGDTVPADLVVFATGYGSMRDAVRDVVGEAAEGIGSIHELDDEGELTSVWRPTGVPGLWIMLGNIQMVRYYSRVLALQIKARQLGLV
ncbi:NAD(P)/FAD-dependent oxidoreductase [Pseudonocardia ailaonensis]|uniref:NAD(P)/FAD-dependent oxidoreductase n=1 Tax=Pseudonocardia ailaonensis TaxID=367279 RepID=A0ABN2MJ75_9PSEU